MIGLATAEAGRTGGRPSCGGDCRARGRLTCPQREGRASVARERFSCQLRVSAQLRETQITQGYRRHVTAQSCSRAILPAAGGPRACLDSRVCLAGNDEACAPRAYLRGVKVSLSVVIPPPRIGILLRAVCNSVFLSNFLAPRPRTALSRLGCAWQCLVRERGTWRERRKYEKREETRETDRLASRTIVTVDHEIRAGYVATRSPSLGYSRASAAARDVAGSPVFGGYARGIVVVVVVVSRVTRSVNGY